MRRVDLTEATLQGWARLDAAQRSGFHCVREGGAAAGQAEPRWLRRRLKNRRLPNHRSGQFDLRMPTLPFS